MHVTARRGLSLVVLMAAACLESAPTTAVGPPPATGLFVFHIAGGRFDTHIQLWNIREVADPVAPLRLAALPTRWWDGSPDLQVDPRHSAGILEGGEYRWTLDLGAGDTLLLRYVVVGDTARGTVVENHAGTVLGPLSVVGVRISALTAAPAPVRSQMSQTDTTPIVLLRVDDIPVTDRDFVERLRARGLWAELAVPTRFVGIKGRPSWEEIRGWADAGFSVAAHSRVHGSVVMSDPDFIGEVLGSLADLAAVDLPTAVFVQPGTWKDPQFFLTSGLFHSWRGSLFRTFTRDFEAYVYPVPQVMPLADSVRLGVGHYTISDGESVASILRIWRAAMTSRRFSVFLVHTLRLASPDALDWFLDSVAVAKQAGRIRLARSTADVFTP